jgi:hypothetical integral membrane protein (TIGR02206 family)
MNIPIFEKGWRSDTLMRLGNCFTFSDMNSTFQLFGIPHILILSAIPVITGFLVWRLNRNRELARTFRISLGTFLLLNELIWYGHNIARSWIHVPYGLPLNLCDIVVWITIAAAFTLKPTLVELAYYWGISGSLMAVLTPDLGVPLASYPGVYFFVAHCGVVITIIFLVWGKLARPRTGSVWKALLWLNAYVALIGGFNSIFQTNYFYLCEKPGSPSLLDYMGPWPWYLLAGELFGVAACWLLWLPIRAQMRKAPT